MLKKSSIFIVFFLCVTVPSFAEDSIYGFNEIDYFGMKGLKKVDQREIRATQDKKEPPIEENLWIEPVVSADGKVSYYRPPQTVIDFLENPTRETGSKYVEWSEKRIEKVQKAQGVLQTLIHEMNIAPSPEPLAKTPAPAAPGTQKNQTRDYVAFFLLDGCPYCEKQKELISDLMKTRPDIKIDVYVKNYSSDAIKTLPFPARKDEGLSRQLGLNVYPSVFLVNRYGKKIVVPGLIEKPLLNDLLEQKI